MTWTLGILTGVLASVLAASVFGYGTRMALWISHQAARLLPEDQRDRCREEWERHILDRSRGPIDGRDGHHHLDAFLWGVGTIAFGLRSGSLVLSARGIGTMLRVQILERPEPGSATWAASVVEAVAGLVLHPVAVCVSAVWFATLMPTFVVPLVLAGMCFVVVTGVRFHVRRLQRKSSRSPNDAVSEEYNGAFSVVHDCACVALFACAGVGIVPLGTPGWFWPVLAFAGMSKLGDAASGLLALPHRAL